MSCRHISANWGLVPVKFNLNWNENMLLSFNGSLLRARLWEHELYSVRSIAFISTVVKSPDNACYRYRELCLLMTSSCFSGGSVSKGPLLECRNATFEPCHDTGRLWCFNILQYSFFVTFTKLIFIEIESISKMHLRAFCAGQARMWNFPHQSSALATLDYQ